MIEVKTCEKDNVRQYRSRIEGSIDQICMDTAIVLRGIYDAIKQHSQSDSNILRKFLADCVSDPEFYEADNSADESLFMDFTDVRKGGQHDEK